MSAYPAPRAAALAAPGGPHDHAVPETPQPSTAPPLAILVHAMGHTRASMALLAHRLHGAGFRTALFGYLVTIDRFAVCRERLRSFIVERAGADPYVVVGHSLGGVLLRAAIDGLAPAPRACFLVTTPSCACTWARLAAPHLAYRLLTGEMGQLLADPDFMRSLPVPSCPTWIYAGTGGPTGRWWPIGDEPNDGVLKVSETRLDGVPVLEVPALHALAVNSRWIARDLAEHARGQLADAQGRAN